MSIKYYFILTLLITVSTASAQSLEVGYGQFGAMVYWQGEIPRSGAEIRRSGGTGDDRIWSVRPAETVADFQRNVTNMPVIFSELFPFTDASAEYYLEKFNDATRIESLPMHKAPNVLFALGLAVWDTTVTHGQTYQYQVFIDGRAVGEATSLNTVFREDFDWAPRFAETTNNEQVIRCRWHIPYERQSEIYSFLAYRTAPFEPDYQLVAGIEAFSVVGDTIHAVFIDTAVAQIPGVYHYMIRTYDRFGMLGPASEYAEGSNFTPTAEPIITYFKAVGLTDRPAIELKWKLLNPWRVRSLALYKSRNWDGPYELVSHFSQHDSTYLDPVTDVMESYFYYFEYDDIAQDEPVKSAKVTSVSEFIWPAEVPDSLNVEADSNTIRVSWKSASSQDRGFYVLRAEGYDIPTEVVSPFIHAVDSLDRYIWVDTSRLDADKYYSYAVVSESIGYEKSAPTEAMSVRLEAPVFIPAPVDLKLTRENDTTFLLRWQDLSGEESNNHFGYRVFQKDPDARNRLRLITPEILTFETNYLVLHNLTPADTFVIRSVNIFGNESADSKPISFSDPLFFRFGPEHVMGKSTEKGVELKWNRSLRSDVIKYHLYRMDDGKNQSVIATLKANETTFLDTAVRPGNMYYYFVTAETTGGLRSEASDILPISR